MTPRRATRPVGHGAAGVAPADAEPDGGAGAPTPDQESGAPRGLLRLRDIGVLAPGYAIPGIASFVTVPILFAILGAAEYGRWALLYGIAAGVPQITTGWLEATKLRFGHRPGRRSDRIRTVAAVAGTIAFSAISALVIVPGAAGTEAVAAALLSTTISLYVLAIAGMQSAMAFGAVSAAASFRAVLGAILGIGAALVSGRAAVAILGLTAGYVAGAIVGRWLSRGQIASRAPDDGLAADEADGPGERVGYGLASGVAAVASYALSVGDRFILSAVRPLAEVGAYAATYTLVDLAGRFLPSIVLVAMRPRVFRAWDRGRGAELGRSLPALAALLGWIVAVASLALAAATLVSDRLPADRALVGPIALGFGCFMAANALGLAYSASTRQGRLAGHLALAAGANVALNLVLIPRLGAVGAAVSTAICYAVLLALNGLDLRIPATVERGPLAIALGALGAFAGLILAGSEPGGDWPVVLSVAALLATTPLVIPVVRQLRRPG